MTVGRSGRNAGSRYLSLKVVKHSSTWPSASMYFIGFLSRQPSADLAKLKSLPAATAPKAQSWKRKADINNRNPACKLMAESLCLFVLL